MLYHVKTIDSWDDLKQCQSVSLSHSLWDKGQPPQTTARIGYLPDQGIALEMVAVERDPLCRYTQPQDPVYMDSAMEFFMTLDESPHPNSMYVNFEFNASGAMLANFGAGRADRKKITEEEYALAALSAEVLADHWVVRLIVPNVLLQRLYGKSQLKAGDSFFFNFYKISEEKSIEHYGSYFPVHSETPNFHRPQDFGKAMITD